jgi:hypothetical protein
MARKQKTQTTTEIRTDGPYLNAFLSVGNGRDRTAYNTVGGAALLTQAHLENLYMGDGFARRIVDLPATEMVRAGYTIDGLDDSEEVLAALENIQAMEHVIKALKWGFLYGGALIVALLDDGAVELSEPLNPERIRAVDQLRVYDRWQVSRNRRYTDPADRRFGKTEIYQISPMVGTPYTVHESRCIVIDGMETPDRLRDMSDGWGNSRLQQCWEQLSRFNLSHIWANALLERAQQAVHGIPNLTEVLRQPNGADVVRARLNAVDMARGINNTVAIDAAESYDLKATSLTNVPDLIDRFSLSLSAVSGIPETLLFGRSPGGLNSTGKSDLENWYAAVEQMQRTTLLPILDQIVAWQLYADGRYTDDYLIQFSPLSVPSEKEVMETRLAKAKVHEIYVNMQALDPSEVRDDIQGFIQIKGDIEIEREPEDEPDVAENE